MVKAQFSPPLFLTRPHHHLERNIWLDELQAIFARSFWAVFYLAFLCFYTVEVWSIGAATEPWWSFTVLAVNLLVVWLLTQVEGFGKSLSLNL